MSEPRRLVVQRLGYSVHPWRIVDSETGREISFPVVFDHPHLGRTVVSECGFATKQQAIERLGEIAAYALTLRSPGAA